MNQPPLPFDRAAKAHLVGIRGAGMTALAELLGDLDWELSGSDQAADATLQVGERQIRIHRGHRKSNVPLDANLLIFSPAVPESNPERVAARQVGVPEISYSQFLGRFMESRTGISVAGTHGKTTTSGILATVLREVGLSPSAAIGGELINYSRSGWGGTSQLFVTESCEYRSHFLDHSPHLATILGIEPDHFDCFPDLDSQIAVFGKFAAGLPNDGLLVIPTNCEATTAAARHATAEIQTIAVEDSVQTMQSSGADWIAHEIQPTEAGHRFRVAFRGISFCDTELRLPGRHNIGNALAAIALTYVAGASPNAIAEALPEFAGVRRRFEIVNPGSEIILVDDYAHHPTAIRATLKTARQQFETRRLLVAFQPHQISRTQKLMADFATSFSDADEVFLAPIFAARESSEQGEATLTELRERIGKHGCQVSETASLDQLKDVLDHAARPGDVVMILGAGDISRIAHEFASRKFSRNHAG